MNKGAVNQNEYAYDGLNQRVWTHKLPSPTASSPNPSTAVKTYEIYSSNGQLLTEYTPSQGKVDEHIYLGTKRIGLASRTGAAASVNTHFHLDPAATPLLATTGVGAVAWKENHSPYGDKLNNPANATANTIGYAGKPYDNATGLSYMGARYYHPTLGRFTGIDPVGFTEGNIHSHNRYTYANNNPYKFVDPDGRVAVPVVGFVIGFGVDATAQFVAGLIDGKSPIESAKDVSLMASVYAEAATAVTVGVGFNQAMNVAKGITTLGAAMTTTSVVGASSNVAANVASKATKGEQIDPVSLGFSAGTGAFGGAWGVNSLGKAISPSVQGVNKAVEGHITTTTLSSGYPSSGVATSAAKTSMLQSIPSKTGLSTGGKVSSDAISKKDKD